MFSENFRPLRDIEEKIVRSDTGWVESWNGTKHKDMPLNRQELRHTHYFILRSFISNVVNVDRLKNMLPHYELQLGIQHIFTAAGHVSISCQVYQLKITISKTLDGTSEYIRLQEHDP